MNCYNKLEDIIYAQKKCVTIANLCYMFNIHIDDAQRLVSDFVDKAIKDGKELDITYILSGYKNEDGDEIKLQRFITAKENELEEAKKYFTEISSSQIRSLCLKGYNQQPNGYDKETSLITTNDELLRNQKLSRITNSSISLRQDLIRKFNYQNGFLDDSPTVKESSKDVKDEESNKAHSFNTKGKNNSKKMVNFFTKFNTQNNNKESQKIHDNKESEEPKMFESEDEEVEDDNEDPIITKLQKKVPEKETRKPAEKRKRIRVFNDSDSEGSQHVNDINDNEEPKQKIAKITEEEMKIEIIDEVFEDEDGYIVTKKVKKMVSNKEPSESEDLENEENIRHSKETKVLKNKNDKSKKNSKNVVDKSDEDEKPKKKSEESEKKPKAKNKAIPKGQVSITSFFKPAMK